MEKSMRGPVAVGGTRSPVSLRRRATSPRKPAARTYRANAYTPDTNFSWF